MNLLKNKREEFSINIRRERREEIFKQKRLIHKEQNLPFSLLNNDQATIYFNAFYYKHTPSQQYDENIWKIIKIAELAEYFQNQDCENNYDSSVEVDLCFELLDKNYPIINRACIQILLTFTLSNNLACKPILRYLPELLDFFKETQFEELRQQILIIISNLAADCYQCRDAVLIYECPQKIFKHLQKLPPSQEMDDLAQILLNISRMKPFINNYNQIQMYKICLQMFAYLQDKEIKKGILQFILKIYSFDKNHLDVNFIHKLCLDDKINKECLNELLSLLRILSLFDRAKYEYVEQDILTFLIGFINNINFTAAFTIGEQKQINKLLNIFHNFLLENPQLLEQLLNSNISKLFYLFSQNQQNLLEIYTNSPFYTFYLEILYCFNNQQLEQFVNIFKPVQQLIVLADQDLSEDAQILLLKILEILIKKNLSCKNCFTDYNGQNLLAKLSQQESDELFDICERIFDLIS